MDKPKKNKDKKLITLLIEWNSLNLNSFKPFWGSNLDIKLCSALDQPEIGNFVEHTITRVVISKSLLQLLTVSGPTCFFPIIPVRTLAFCSNKGRLLTSSKELKWWTSWCSPYMPFWCCGRPVINTHPSTGILPVPLTHKMSLKFLYLGQDPKGCGFFKVPCPEQENHFLNP